MTAAFETLSHQIYRNVEEALVGEAMLLLQHGQTVTVRGSTTRELLARTFSITNPLQRIVALQHRHNHPAAAIIDTLWVLSGRNDIAAVTPYLPRAPQFSDDGTTWRGGYGPRLRHWQGIDQLDYVRRVLLDDPQSRRAVISLYDPATDSVLGREGGPSLTTPRQLPEPSGVPSLDMPRSAQSDARLDVPCNNWLHFLVRDGCLDLFVVARSNDLMWGFSGVNAFQWSVLHELMAKWIGSSVGQQHWAVSSMHLYERHLDRARSIVADWDGNGTYTDLQRTNRYQGRWEHFDSDLATWFEIEHELRTAEEPHWDRRFGEGLQDPFLLGCLMVVEDHWRMQAGLPPDIGAGSGSAAAAIGTDLLVAMGSYRDRQPFSAPAAAPVGAKEARLPSAGRQEPGQAAADEVARLKDRLRATHRMKSAAYGDSWKRRGELLGVLPNVARKVDRLRNQVDWQAEDRESAVDTWADLVTYLLKYETLLADQSASIAATLFGFRPHMVGAMLGGSMDEGFSDGVLAFEALLTDLKAVDEAPSPRMLDEDVNHLQKLLETASDAHARYNVVARMASEAFAGLIAAAAADRREHRHDQRC